MNNNAPNRRPGGLFERISSVIFGTSGHGVIDQQGAPAPVGEPESESDTVDAATLDEVREQLARNRKVEAIKAYREATGCELVDAKRAVERIALADGLREAA